jgi:hypothetical protein
MLLAVQSAELFELFTTSVMGGTTALRSCLQSMLILPAGDSCGPSQYVRYDTATPGGLS